MTFQWSSGTSVTEYFFYVGTGVGLNDLYGQSQGLNLSVTVNGLPANGSTLYVRLYWQISGLWYATDYTYTATTACSYAISPNSASPSAGSGSGNFVMTAGSGCSWNASTGYGWIHSTSSGSGNGTVSYTYDANASASSRSGTITAGGQTFTLTQAGVTVTPTITSPSAGSTLSSASATFQWNSGTSVTEYFFYIGTSVGTNDLYGQSQGLNLSVTLTGLPVNGSPLFVRLWWKIGGVWQTADYTYTAATITTATAGPAITVIKQGNNLVLKWPTNDSAFNLFYTTNLSAAWVSNAAPPSIVSGQYTITNSMTNKFMFFRLKK